MLGESVTLAEAFKITGLSMFVVFVVLFVICQMLELFRVVFYNRELSKESKKQNESVGTQYGKKSEYIDMSNPESEEDMVAVIAASAIFSDSGARRDLRIKSIKRV